MVMWAALFDLFCDSWWYKTISIGNRCMDIGRITCVFHATNTEEYTADCIGSRVLPIQVPFEFFDQFKFLPLNDIIHDRLTSFSSFSRCHIGLCYIAAKKLKTWNALFCDKKIVAKLFPAQWQSLIIFIKQNSCTKLKPSFPSKPCFFVCRISRSKIVWDGRFHQKSYRLKYI